MGTRSVGCSVVLLLLCLIQRSQGVSSPQADPGFWVRANELAARLRELKSSSAVGSSSAPGAVTLMTGRSPSFTLHDTAAYKSNATALDLSRFKTVLGVDERNGLIHVEAMVTAEELVNAALAHGMVPKVVPAFRHVSVGGAVMGSATSSSSHRFGQFHDACRSLTVLLGNGTIVKCSKTLHPELFHSLSGSYGSLAVLLSAEIECVPATPTVLVTVTRHPTVEAGLQHVKRKCRFNDNTDPASPPLPPGPVPDFIEALVPGSSPSTAHAKRQLPPIVTITAAFEPPRPSDQAPVVPWFDCGGSTDLFFHEYVIDDVAATLEAAALAAAAAHTGGAPRVPHGSSTFRMPLTSYLFRFDRGAYWLAQPGQPSRLSLLTAWFYAFSSRSYLARLIGRWLYKPSTIFGLFQLATPDVLAKRIIVMNPSLPIDRAADMVAFTRTTVPLLTTPIHLCPVRGAQARQPFSPQGHIDTLFMEVGIYGRIEDGSAREHSRRLEHFVASQHGRKSLCGQNFYEPGEFWGGFPTYDPHEYRYLRDKYQADGVFPPIDVKVCEPHPPQAASLIRRYVDSRRRKLTNFLL